MSELSKLAYRPREVVEIIGLSRSTVYELLRTGQLRSIRVNKRILVPKSAVEQFLAVDRDG